MPSSGYEDKRSLLQKILEFINPGPDSQAELYSSLSHAETRHVIGSDTRVMLEGVIRIADMTAGDVMVPAPRMDLIDIGWDYARILKEVINTAHSRFPVYEGAKDNIVGVLLAKDLLKLQRAPELISAPCCVCPCLCLKPKA